LISMASPRGFEPLLQP